MSSVFEPSLDPKFASLSIHGAPGPDPSTGAILTPIHQSTTFVHFSPEEQAPADIIADLDQALALAVKP